MNEKEIQKQTNTENIRNKNGIFFPKATLQTRP